MKLSILNETEIDAEHIRLYLSNCETVELKLDCFNDEVNVFVGDKNVGVFGFKKEDEGEKSRSNIYLLQEMKILEQYRRMGIGTRVIRFFKDYNDAVIVASPNDGQRKDDGSHLVDNGPAFVQKMKEMGLIDKNNDDYDDDEEY